MSIVVDANVAIAVLNPSDPFHLVALRRVLAEEDVRILNLTRAEALIHPTRAGVLAEANRELDRIGVTTDVLDDGVADRARELRAVHGSKGFPLIDAAVVALGIERDCSIVTCDAKWPEIPSATVERLVLEA